MVFSVSLRRRLEPEPSTIVPTTRRGDMAMETIRARSSACGSRAWRTGLSSSDAGMK